MRHEYVNKNDLYDYIHTKYVKRKSFHEKYTSKEMLKDVEWFPTASAIYIEEVIEPLIIIRNRLDDVAKDEDTLDVRDDLSMLIRTLESMRKEECINAENEKSVSV